jgi:hypothetical protein
MRKREDEIDLYENDFGVIIGFYESGTFEVAYSFSDLTRLHRQTRVRIKFPSERSAIRMLRVHSPEEISGDVLSRYLNRH